MKVMVVGAGLAGLTCARVLRERGAEVAAFEASDSVSVRTDEKDRFLLDRGFQVYSREYTEDSSVDGSMLSDEKAAREVLG